MYKQILYFLMSINKTGPVVCGIHRHDIDLPIKGSKRMNYTAIAFLAFVSWILVLLVWIGSYRTMLVMNKTKAPNSFKSDGSDASAFGQRLVRTHGNAVESFPFVGGMLLLALATDSAFITDGLALWLLVARFGQSLTHLISTSVIAVQVRFAFFIAQLAICFYWAVLLASKFIA